jgi:hypothetical protein
MSPGEVVRRLRDEFAKQALRLTRGVESGSIRVAGGPAPLRPGLVDHSTQAASTLISAAEKMLAGEWRTLGVVRRDMDQPDWFLDPETGIRAPSRVFTFHINPRRADEVGNVKNVWELSRHHHLTLLAAAYHLTGREQFAETVARHLRSWWQENPFLRGIHWRSGIELGVRLISWVWVRRLLEGWAGAPDLFERNPAFVEQLYGHCRYLARLPSHGSSANNHLIAERAGQFVACCAFPYFSESETWREVAARSLRDEARRQTFPSGLNRELATGYHAFVLELLLAAALEGEASGSLLGAEFWGTLVRMTDALAAVVDVGLEAPRQGDADEGTALLLDGDPHPWRALLSTGERLFGRCEWWPRPGAADCRTMLWTSLMEHAVETGSRPEQRPSLFPDAGLVILRDLAPGADEMWCRCDSGPHGYLSIASHAHADALAVEVRLGGRTILSDPGTFCYHTRPQWREYFRSTLAHNTLEIAGRSQSVSGGPFNWLWHADGRVVAVDGLDEGDIAEWLGEHGGYASLSPPAVHRRRVRLDRRHRSLTIHDEVICEGTHPCRLAFHLGPEIDCRLEGPVATLHWEQGVERRRAVMMLPEALVWELAQGREDPPGGWYSPRLGVKVPAVSLFGVGGAPGDAALVTRLEFGDAGPAT